jgi:hypothetical protein
VLAAVGFVFGQDHGLHVFDAVLPSSHGLGWAEVYRSAVVSGAFLKGNLGRGGKDRVFNGPLPDRSCAETTWY